MRRKPLVLIAIAVPAKRQRRPAGELPDAAVEHRLSRLGSQVSDVGAREIHYCLRMILSENRSTLFGIMR
jgi:hypothetical protein